MPPGTFLYRPVSPARTLTLESPMNPWNPSATLRAYELTYHGAMVDSAFARKVRTLATLLRAIRSAR